MVHADTIGCMVRRLKDNGRLELIPVGTFSARFATGARVRIFSDDPEAFITGTVMPLKASGHAFGDEIDAQPATRARRGPHRPQGLIEGRSGQARPRRRGLRRADHQPRARRDGFIVSRHLDGKAGVAVALALARNFSEQKLVLPHRTTIDNDDHRGSRPRSKRRPAFRCRRTCLGGQCGVRPGPALDRGWRDDPDG